MKHYKVSFTKSMEYKMVDIGFCVNEIQYYKKIDNIKIC